MEWCTLDPLDVLASEQRNGKLAVNRRQDRRLRQARGLKRTPDTAWTAKVKRLSEEQVLGGAIWSRGHPYDRWQDTTLDVEGRESRDGRRQVRLHRHDRPENSPTSRLPWCSPCRGGRRYSPGEGQVAHGLAADIVRAPTQAEKWRGRRSRRAGGARNRPTGRWQSLRCQGRIMAVVQRQKASPKTKRNERRPARSLAATRYS